MILSNEKVAKMTDRDRLIELCNKKIKECEG